MQNAAKHSINKVFLEVNTESNKTAYYLKDYIDTFLKDELFPLLETYFDTIDKKICYQSLQIEKLDMSLSPSEALDFESIKLEIVNQFQKQIKNQIDKGFPDSKQYTLISEQEKSVNEFFSFLESGISPWWTVSKEIGNNHTAYPLEKIIEEKTFVPKIITLLQNRQSRIRFIKQLTDKQIYDIIKKAFALQFAEITISEHISNIKNNMKTVVIQSKQGLQQRNLIWEITLLKLLNYSESMLYENVFNLIHSFDSVRKFNPKFVFQNREQIHSQIKSQSVLATISNINNEALIASKMLQQKASEQLQKNKKQSDSKRDDASEFHYSNVKTLENEEAILSHNKELEDNSTIYDSEKEELLYKENLPASLLLHEEIIGDEPSNHYVNNAGLILVHPFLKTLFENCALLNKDNSIKDRELAAHLLHYIATEKEQDYENEMQFEKLLCNIPLKQTINRNIVLTDELKNQADEMLQAVLENWPVMKNASLALLRNEYLQRPGKIILTGDHPKVLVERKTQDILLDKIAWNLGVVKLAWRDKIIFVDW